MSVEVTDPALLGSLRTVHVLDQLLYMLPVVSAGLAIVSLVSRRIPIRGGTGRNEAPTPASESNRRRIVSGLTLWLALRLMFVWVIVLLVRLLFALSH
jgi:hypothetical protein